MDKERIEQLIALSEQILIISRNTLFVNQRFLENALGRFELVPYPGTVGTDGQCIYFHPVHIIKRYRESERLVVHDLLHMVLHCVYRHSFVALHTFKDRELWDLACDIAVEAVILELPSQGFHNERVHEKNEVLRKLREEMRVISAERVIEYLKKKAAPVEIESMTRIFKVDDHDMWYQPPKLRISIIGAVMNALGMGGGEGEDGESDSENGQGNGGGGDSKQDSEAQSLASWLESRTKLSDLWRDVSDQILKAAESFKKQIGNMPGSMVESLKELNRERYDYSAFLKKFAVHGEVMRLDPDEFDYNFYAYGLQLYGNVALIEPLEYRDEKRIREFVIAIDTSGSVHGLLVQKFLTKTYNIMKSTDSFFSRINVWIVQCDTVIQDAVQITCQEDFDNYIRDLKLKGFGGTDFRPVFDFVNQKIDEKVFTNLKGLIYFTDGFGIYPDAPGGDMHDPTYPHRKPKYETAFVFMRSDYERSLTPNVPPWAIKLILEDEDLESEPVQL